MLLHIYKDKRGTFMRDQDDGKSIPERYGIYCMYTGCDRAENFYRGACCRVIGGYKQGEGKLVTMFTEQDTRCYEFKCP